MGSLLAIVLLIGAITTACGGETQPESFSTPSIEPSTQGTTVPPGWKKFSTDEIEFWLPPSYEGGAPNSALFEGLIKGFRDMGRGNMAAGLETGKIGFILFMLDTDASNAGTSANVVSQPHSGEKLEALIDEAVRALSKEAVVSEHKIVRVGSRQAGRVVLDRGVQYYILGSKSDFTVTFKAATAQDFLRLLPLFDQSGQTIVVH